MGAAHRVSSGFPTNFSLTLVVYDLSTAVAVGVLCPAVLVKIRFCGGCLVSRAHKTSLRLILFCICRVLPSSLLTLKVVIINTTAYIIERQIIDDDFISATRGMASPSSVFGLFPTVNVILETKTEVLTT